VYDFRVACKASALRHTPISRLYPDWLVKVLQRERQGMIEPIVGLGEQCSQMIVGKVTVIAYRYMTVARILPGVIVSLHYVTIRARCWFITQVAPALAITKRKRSNSNQDAEH
jgi:hypothetical protein